MQTGRGVEGTDPELSYGQDVKRGEILYRLDENARMNPLGALPGAVLDAQSVDYSRYYGVCGESVCKFEELGVRDVRYAEPQVTASHVPRSRDEGAAS